jgi:hypothetical protein
MLRLAGILWSIAALSLVVGCRTPPGCARAISGGLVVEGCFRQVQSCRFHRYRDGSVDAYAISLDALSGNFASTLKAGFYAAIGFFGFGPAGAGAGAGASVVEDVMASRQDRPMCWEEWSELNARPPP